MVLDNMRELRWNNIPNTETLFAKVWHCQTSMAGDTIGKQLPELNFGIAIRLSH